MPVSCHLGRCPVATHLLRLDTGTSEYDIAWVYNLTTRAQERLIARHNSLLNMSRRPHRAPQEGILGPEFSGVHENHSSAAHREFHNEDDEEGCCSAIRGSLPPPSVADMNPTRVIIERGEDANYNQEGSKDWLQPCRAQWRASELSTRRVSELSMY